jgi:hypothetical protein
VRRFVAAYARGDSMCHQLIMGAGKTTVIGPLLALLLGDGNTLVMQVGLQFTVRSLCALGVAYRLVAAP